MCRMAVLPHMIERPAGRHMVTLNAICPGGHKVRDAELREAWEQCTGLDSGGVFDVCLEENRVLGGHWLVNVGCRQDFGDCIMWSSAERQRAGMKGLGRWALWDG